jgi:hypothetical protein
MDKRGKYDLKIATELTYHEAQDPNIYTNSEGISIRVSKCSLEY